MLLASRHTVAYRRNSASTAASDVWSVNVVRTPAVLCLLPLYCPHQNYRTDDIDQLYTLHTRTHNTVQKPTFTGLAQSAVGSGQCSRIRILRFISKLKKTRFLRFFEMTCQKNVENVVKVSE